MYLQPCKTYEVLKPLSYDAFKLHSPKWPLVLKLLWLQGFHDLLDSPNMQFRYATAYPSPLSPLRNSPLRNSPLRNSPLRNSLLPTPYSRTRPPKAWMRPPDRPDLSYAGPDRPDLSYELTRFCGHLNHLQQCRRCWQRTSRY